MATNHFGLLIIAVGFAVQFVHHRFVIYLTVSLTLFGAAAAVVLPSLGGASILIPTAFMFFFCLRLFRLTGLPPAVGSLLYPSPGFWLMLLTVYGLFATAFYPRLMAGATETLIMQRLPGGLSRIALTPLTFTNGHITQTVYALGDLVCFAFSFAIFRTAGAYRHLLTGIFLLCSLNIAFAALDLVTYAAGTTELLDFVRTANYSLLTSVEMGGLKRITGTFPEASAFANFTLILFATMASLYLDDVKPHLTGVLALSLLLLLGISTSGTAYVGVTMVLLLLFAVSIAPLLAGRPIRKLAVTLIAGLSFITVVSAVAVTVPWFTEAVALFLDEAVFGKLSSNSGRERGYWNEVAWNNFVDSGALGVGIGGARASNYAFVLLSNVGLPGMILFLLFLGCIFMNRVSKRLNSDEVRIIRAIRCGMAANLIASILIGTVYDLGVLFYLLAGAAGAAALPEIRRTRIAAQPDTGPAAILGASTIPSQYATPVAAASRPGRASRHVRL